MEEKSYHHSLKYVFFFFSFHCQVKKWRPKLKINNCPRKHYNDRAPFFFPSYITWRHEKREGSREAEGMSSTIWRRKEKGVRGSIRMHPTSTWHTIRPVLHFANLYPGCWFRVFPWKKKKKKGERERERERRSFFFFQVSVCFHEQEWLRHTNKPLFPGSQMQGPSSDLRPTPRHICTFL